MTSLNVGIGEALLNWIPTTVLTVVNNLKVISNKKMQQIIRKSEVLIF